MRVLEDDFVLSAAGLSVLQALATTIRVDTELECLHGSVRRLLVNMSKHEQDVDFTLAAGMWISPKVPQAERNWKTIAKPAVALAPEVWSFTSMFVASLGHRVQVDCARRATMCAVLSRGGRVLSSMSDCVRVHFLRRQ